MYLFLELEDIMATSTDYDKLTNVWKGWRDATGKKMKDTYASFVNLSNTAIRELGQHIFHSFLSYKQTRSLY